MTNKPPSKQICIFTGSRRGVSPAYAAAAETLARDLVARGYGLVYGGGKVGLMNVVAEAVLERGGHVTGVIPGALVSREVAHAGLSELRVVASMHERKALMAELADGFVALPGGIGTLEELVEVMTWGQLGIHAKPIGVLDAAGYYAALGGFLDHMVAEGFLHERHRAGLLADAEPASLLDRMAAWQPPNVHKWLDLERS